MSVGFDNRGFQDVINDMKALEENYRVLYNQLRSPDMSQFTPYDKKGQLKDAISAFTKQYQRTQALGETLIKYRRLKLDSLNKGQAEMEGLENPDYVCPGFDSIEVKPYSNSYPQYRSYQFFQSGKSFSKNYNDIGSFIESKLFRVSSGVMIGSQKLTDFITWIDMGISEFTHKSYYTATLANNALISILGSLPNAGTEAFSGSIDFVENSLGINTLEDWIKYTVSMVKTLAEGGKPGLEILGDLEDEGLLKLFKEETYRKMARNLLTWILDEDSWQTLYNAADSAGNVIDCLEWIDIGFECFGHFMTDYSVQLSYLDSMEEALYSAGLYNATPLIDEVRLEYENGVYHAAKKIGMEAMKEVMKGTIKDTGKKLSGISLASKLFSTYGTTMKLLNNGELKADESLAGLCQFDGALTIAYERYVRMMEDGVATTEDMEQADKLFTILVAAKKKEYKNMMEIAEGTPDYNIYKAKYDELSALSDNSSGGSGFDLFDSLNGAIKSTGENIAEAVKKAGEATKEIKKQK